MNDYLSLLHDAVWLVPLLPLLAAAGNAWCLLQGAPGGDAAEPPVVRLSEWSALGALLLLLLIDLSAWLYGMPGERRLGTWFGTASWQAEISFLLDGLSLPLATLAALIGWLVLRFSANYLHREPGFRRFFIVLGLFLGGIQLVFLAANSLLLFVGWELCGLASFLLIGFQQQRTTATGNALFAFVCNRIGDAGLLFALGLSAWWQGGFAWPAAPGSGVGIELGALEMRVLALGFVLAALVKSAQLPFTPWIAKAQEGPTPSSAIFYGAVMVHAGIYLLLRLQPLLARLPDIQSGLLAIGLLTAVYAWLRAQVQTDVKSALIHAGVFQVALMLIAIGSGWTALATWHLCLHAAWRAWQFLRAPSWLELASRRPAPPPAWLARHRGLYTAVLQAFWLDRLGQVLLVQPTESFAHDLRRFEHSFVDRAIGEPGQGEAIDPALPLLRADGWPGRLLATAAVLLQRLENHLLPRGRGGEAERHLRRFANYLANLENLLEQPRYLMMAVMATFVVIL